jgi:hypothetical protein
MPKGRPRLSPEELRTRIEAYCARYGVAPNAEGLPPFPTGRRESDQHREWIAVYKAHRRLADYARSDDDTPREDTPEERERLHARQRGLCPVCGGEVARTDPLDQPVGSEPARGLVHGPCQKALALIEPAGPDGLDRLRRYIWPGRLTKGSSPAPLPRLRHR